MKLTSEMIRAARALLRWEQADLAAEAGVSLPTVKRIEKEPGPIPGRNATAQAIETAFADAGIEFTYDRGEGVTKLRAGAVGQVSG
ncbi:helix-turn-helix protein [Rhodopseudomonas thermotolerans]|uniref:Helix-turn-helix protein n=2 Tax=Rhodopseudomonas TaxID=1073 RepID=A0A336JM52_9BRAD|nr:MULTISPECIES: helix-turn-helix domain-containing protein [Rhodopseudomonas]RED36198.1 helix-turn-helix protein [Rhodopseudomonas pentothenatexigens]REG03570.1 helix-turn-helix protein [Rhodopseudomonas thermotolerans]SSW90758.1 helix-turn-helix protein [Rhodopseudomonas pentothenatexigens]